MSSVVMLAVVEPVFSDSVDTAVSSYKDRKNKIQNISFQGSAEVFSKPSDEEELGRKLNLSFGASQRMIEYFRTDNSNITVDQQLDGDTRYTESNFNLGLTKGLGVGRDLGVSIAQTSSRIAKVLSLGVSYGHWWMGETLQTIFAYTDSKSNQEPVLTFDSDRATLETPEHTVGQNGSMTLMHYTRPTTISRMVLSYGKRSDRPDAWSAATEIREAFPSLLMSLFVELGYYENLGEISTSTLFGEVLAHSAKLTYSQRLGSDSRWILVSQYRYFKQKIIPRDKEVEDLHTGTDMVSVTARYRLGDGIWTDPASELYFGASKYFKNSTDLRGDKEEPVVGDFVLAGYKHEW